jgi:acylaminoacyl-peptidase
MIRYSLSLVPLLACAQISIDSYWQWRTPSSPAITPGGGSVVYSLAWNDPKADTSYSNLWIASLHGENRPLTTGGYRDSAPAVSPDGTRVAFLSNRSGSRQVHVRWLDGRNEGQVTRADPPPAALAWSADGKWIAYTAFAEGSPAFAIRASKPPNGAAWGPPPNVVTRMRWRADKVPDQGLVQDGENHLFIVPADGGAPRRITTPGISVSGDPSWTPDGKAIVIAAHAEPQGDRELYREDIYICPLQSEPRKLASLTGDEANPVVSPDGRMVAFTGFEDKGNAHHTGRLYVTGIGGGATKWLATGLDRDLSRPVWRSDSRALYAVAEDRGAAHLYEIDIDGGYRALTSGQVRHLTAYAQSDSFSMSRDGRIAITRSSPLEPKEIVTFAVSEPDKVSRLTRTNDALIEQQRPGAVEEIVYPSFDGKQIQAWIIKPPAFDAHKKYPLILDIHGGPHAMYGVEFNWQMQAYATRGFVVLYTNPRGSTGYGEEFGNMIYSKYPGDDYKDLMAGVDAVITKGYADPAKLFVTGGSGGGILTAWTVTQTNRFAAAVSQYPVINWITQAGSSDIPLLMHRWMKSTPWQNPQQYLSRSPLFFAGNVTTPTMLLTGEEDWRTPIAQTEEFYIALKTRGVDTAMVRFPKEPHGIRGPYPSHWVLKVEYILGWFERYLKK